MPKAKKPVEEERPVEEPEQIVEECDEGSGFDMGRMLNQESVQHLMKAGMELVQVMEKSIPKKTVPKQVKVHYNNIQREFLLMTRAVIDWQISELDKKRSTKASEPKLRKIELQ
jgi:hypothetical protein